MEMRASEAGPSETFEQRRHDARDRARCRKATACLHGGTPHRRPVMTTLTQRVNQANERFRSTRDARSSRDIALLAARIGLAWVFVYHGARTLFSAFGGSGIHPQAVYFAHVAHLQPGTFFAVLGGIIECFGGAAVGLGIFGRLAAAGLVGDMVMAMITVTFSHGVIGTAGSGYELNVALAALALVVAILGTGRLSLDAFLRNLLHR
jgi:putative oxidoreductase